MNLVLLKMKCNNLSTYKDGTLEIDFITEKRTSKSEIEDNAVFQIARNLYKLNTIALMGVNASGKTTTMRVMTSILDIYIGNSSLKYDMSLMQYFSDSLEIESYYYDQEKKLIYKITSHIKKDLHNMSVFFTQEKLYSKNMNSQINRTNLYDFDEDNLILDRSNINNVFLKQEDSIFSSIMNKIQNENKLVIDMCDVNTNLLSTIYATLLMDFVNYLDPSITKFEVLNDETPNKLPMIRLAFKNKPQEYLVEIFELGKYLSSGTIKGIVFLSNIIAILNNGGYLLVDEIENHLNKTIVMNIINLFNSKINKHASTLVLSTHYSEIVDTIPRSDSIYILSNQNCIVADKYSTLAGAYDRIDKKKSDVILSGVISSSPTYRAYIALTKSLKAEMKRYEASH